VTALPVDSLIPEILNTLRNGTNLVLEAPPGAGKTTRVPAALLSLDLGEVLVLEPRRLAARMAARRVAAERNEPLGETVGYQVRFENVGGPRTRLRFLTEGVLARRLLSDPSLRGVGAVVLDEFHERNLEGDLALALLRRLQTTLRPDLRIVVMSATLDAAPIAAYLGGCPVLRSEGRLFDLSITHTPHSPKPLEEQIAEAVELLLREGLAGDILTFLPGAAEIRRAAKRCAPIAERAGLLVVPLHGDLPPAEQDRAVQPADRPKLILSTNIAESSITIEGVRAVIDSGVARVAVDSPRTGLPTLQVQRISKASAIQRAGRAGRLGPGRVIRLFPLDDFVRRPEQRSPEILQRELSQVVLDLTAMGIQDPLALPWLDAPPQSAIDHATELLQHLGAIDGNRTLTDVGRKMAGLPLHPRLARLIVEAESRRVGEDGCAAAALLSHGARLNHERHATGPSDLLALLDSEWDPQARRLYDQIRRVAGVRRQSSHNEKALLAAILAAFPDRVARKRGADQVILASGGAATLSEASVVRNHEWLVAVDIEERRERGQPVVRLASGIEPDWLLDLFPEKITERQSLEWNWNAERVEAVSALLYENLAIEESRDAKPDTEQAARLLAEKALEAGIERFVDMEELEAFLRRIRFASRHAAVDALGQEDVHDSLRSLCYGLRSFAELRQAAGDGGILQSLEAKLSAASRQILEKIAPAKLRLPSGRQARVHYEDDRPPWVASRLQDFFGMRETPRVAGGAVPVVVHLLAPNQRPVQMTSDLAGFWQRLYPQVRRELSRRYPKHSWPEDPTAPLPNAR